MMAMTMAMMMMMMAMMMVTTRFPHVLFSARVCDLGGHHERQAHQRAHHAAALPQRAAQDRRAPASQGALVAQIVLLRCLLFMQVRCSPGILASASLQCVSSVACVLSRLLSPPVTNTFFLHPQRSLLFLSLSLSLSAEFLRT